MKKLVIVIIAFTFCTSANSQNPSLELSWLSGSWNPAPGQTQGPSLAPQLQTFQADQLNNGNFSAYTPALTVTTSLRNQQYTGYNYTGQQGTVTTGLSFGTSKSEWNDPIITTQGPRRANLYDILGANVGSYGPTASLYRSFPGEALGTIDADFSQFGSDANGGVSIFTTVEPLRTLPGVDKAGRYYYGDLVITFSRPVKDPVLQIASLGGSSWYQTSVGAPWNISYFTTELELASAGLTSVKLSGTPYLEVTADNKILNNAVRPNGDSQTGSIDVKGFSSYGAASGSVQVQGVVTELVYRVYMRGSTLSDYPFSFDAVGILGASRNPFYGDFWAIGYSMKKPTQQIFGNVYIDKDITDNDINKSFGLPNDKTNANGQLYANLISGGLVVATVPVGSNGAYVFDNVAVGTYVVQLSSNQGVIGQPFPAAALPPNWSRTGEFIGSGPGSDGIIDGFSSSFPVAAGSIITEVNFGIRPGTCPDNILYTVPPSTNYFGGFELAQNFYPTGVNLANGPGRIYARTNLAPANYSITTNPNTFGLSSFNSVGGQNQMVVKPAANDVVYYLVDSLGKNTNGYQTYLLSGTGSSFKGWLAKSSAADASVRIKIYDGDDNNKVFKDVTISLTGIPGNWIYFDQPWTVNYGTPGLPTTTKKVRLDIISVNGVPFSIDELCFTENASGPILPIVISDFTANNNTCTANLVWKTSTESNSDRFEVEVRTSVNPVFTKAGTVAASGYSNVTKTYSFNYNMQPGVYYFFRLKLVDKDGSFTYSDTRTVNCTKGNRGIVVAPNPVYDKFKITGMEDGKNTVTVFASNGQLVKSQVIAQNQGEVNIYQLSPGLYAVKITSETGNTFVTKIVKN